MRNQIRKSSRSRLPSSPACLLGLALMSCLLLLPSPARGQTTQTALYTDLSTTFTFCNTYGGYIQNFTALVDFPGKVAEFLGWSEPPNMDAAILAEIDRICNSLSTLIKSGDITTINEAITTTRTMLNDYSSYMVNGHLDPTTTYGSAIEQQSIAAVTAALDPPGPLNPDGQCAGKDIFQILPPTSKTNVVYDWRLGIADGLIAVATRLMAIGILWPDFRTTGSKTTELTAYRNCLIQHRDLIRAPRPNNYCRVDEVCAPAGGGCGCDSVTCKEWRSWPTWPVTALDLPSPNCSIPPSFPSEEEFWDLEAVASSTIDNNNLANVLFALERMIDTLYVLTSPLTTPPANQHISFGANPLLCLSQSAAGNVTLDNCTSTSSLLNWSYDPGTGRIMNAGSNQCISAQGIPNSPVSLQMVTCVDNDNSSIWDRSPESGVIKNSFGSALTVLDAVPAVGSQVWGRVATPWYLNKQVWILGSGSSCSGAICPITGSAAWNQGTIAGSGERYPIDFSIFAYEGISGFQDVAGPIAAAESLSATGFSINGLSGLPDALVVEYGPVSLANGTIRGMPFLPSAQTFPSSVTVLGPPGYQGPTYTDPINFEMAFLNLQAWSKSLANIQATGTVSVPPPNGGVMTMISTEPSAQPQVFNVDGSAAYNARTIQFEKLPASATILINVSGAEANFWSLGFSGLAAGNNVLWNFPEATTVKMSYVPFFGSVLAPFANVTLNWGKEIGTMVSWSLASSSEFDWNPLSTYTVMKGP